MVASEHAAGSVIRPAHGNVHRRFARSWALWLVALTACTGDQAASTEASSTVAAAPVEVPGVGPVRSGDGLVDGGDPGAPLPANPVAGAGVDSMEGRDSPPADTGTPPPASDLRDDAGLPVAPGEPTAGQGPPMPLPTTPPADPPPPVPAPPTEDPAPIASAGCGTSAFGPGDHEVSVQWEGRRRQYFIHVPPGYQAETPTPLVLDIHPLFANAAAQRSFSESDRVADDVGWITVYPNSETSAWNAGPDCCSNFVEENPPDDVAFMVDVVSRVSAQLCVDQRRVYAMGFSNGGWMSHTLACKAEEVFAAVAPCCAALAIPYSDCTPERPVSVYHIHSLADETGPYRGNALLQFKPIPEVLDFWARTNGCDAMAVPSERWGGFECSSYPDCDQDAEVTLCLDDTTGHNWPGRIATEAAFSFFERHPRR